MIRAFLAATGAAFILSATAHAGFIRVAREGHRWWLVDGAGKKFISRGMDCVGMGAEPAKFDPANPGYCALKHYPSPEAWTSATMKRLASWGFNTVGGHSDTPLVVKSGAMPFAVALVLGIWLGVPWADPASPEAIKTYEKEAAVAAAYRDNPLLIGYFTDNELGWWDESVFTYWLGRPATERVKHVLYAMLDAEYHGDVRRLAADMKVVPAPAAFAELKNELKSVAFVPGRRPLVVERFMEWFAEEYYRAVARAVRKHDPNHLLLGDRYASYYSQPVARAAGRHMDVVSTNYNTFAKSGWISPSFFDTLYRLSRKPLMVTEYYFSAMENASGNRNRKGPFMIVNTQAQRTSGAREMTERLARVPALVGYHWFQYTDEPRFGRSDGEDFNFGVVDIFDRPYPGLVEAFAAANGLAENLHRDGAPAAGLVRIGAGWAVPRAAGESAVDGALDEWDLAAAWAPAPAARQPFLPFGDVYVSWVPEGLMLGIVFLDFSTTPADPAIPASLPRLSVAVERAGAEPLLATLGLIPGPKDMPPAIRAITEDGAAVPRGARLVRAARGATSLTTVAEIFVPRAALGGRRLAAGERVRVAASVRLAGDVKETAWPRAWGGPRPRPRDLAELTLR